MNDVPVNIMQKIENSHLTACGYDSGTRTLIVEFAGGATYVYDDVPAEVHSDLMSAESKGRYFHRKIRDAFKATKIEQPK